MFWAVEKLLVGAAANAKAQKAAKRYIGFSTIFFTFLLQTLSAY